ncbi:MAG: RidA family protein [Myxococcota bacterium]
MRVLKFFLPVFVALPLYSCATPSATAQPPQQPSAVAQAPQQPSVAAQAPGQVGPTARAVRRDYHAGPWEQDIGYSQAVRIGNTLHISGSAGGGAMPNAVREAYGILEKTLRDHGLSFANVVKETVFTTDIEALKQSQDLRKKYYGATLPAASWVQIDRLYGAEHVIEVEAIAVFPE